MIVSYTIYVFLAGKATIFFDIRTNCLNFLVWSMKIFTSQQTRNPMRYFVWGYSGIGMEYIFFRSYRMLNSNVLAKANGLLCAKKMRPSEGEVTSALMTPS